MARPIEKRRFIEEGVVAVIAEKGLRGTTIQDIANAASVSPGLLYRYWRNRDALAGDVYREHTLKLVERLTRLAAAERDVVQKLRVMVRAFLEFADEQPVLLKFLLLSQHDLADSIPREQSVHALVRRIVEEGMAQRRLREMDPDLAVRILLGIVLQPALGAVYGLVSRPVQRHFPEIVESLERALGTGDPGERAAARSPSQTAPATAGETR